MKAWLDVMTRVRIDSIWSLRKAPAAHVLLTIQGGDPWVNPIMFVISSLHTWSLLCAYMFVCVCDGGIGLICESCSSCYLLISYNELLKLYIDRHLIIEGEQQVKPST